MGGVLKKVFFSRMGASVSCDVCETLLNEHDRVYEKKNANPQHACIGCHNTEAHIEYADRSVYDAVGEENARRMKETPQGREQFATALSGFANMRGCEACGAQTVVGEGVTECFVCKRPFIP